MEKERMLEYYRFKDVYDLFIQGKPEEAKKTLQELQARYLTICDENISLRSQVQGYEDILYLARNLVFDGTFYWLITGSIKQGPFCPNCYNRDGLLLRLTDEGSSRQCITCGAYFDRVAPQRAKAAQEGGAGLGPDSPGLSSAGGGKAPTPGNITASLLEGSPLPGRALGIMAGSGFPSLAAANGSAGQESSSIRPDGPTHKARKAVILPFGK